MDFARPLLVITPTLDGDVLAVLARAEEEFSGRQLHRLLGYASEPGVRKAVERLVDQGVVDRRQAGRAKLYRLNRQHLAAAHIEGLANLHLQLIARLRETIGAWRQRPHSAFLFGSVARGDAVSASDLDLLVIRGATVEEGADAWEAQLAALEREATEATGNDARILEYGEQELAAPEIKSVVEEALSDGIELFGSRQRLRRLLQERSG
ncbi:MAG: nucleotidyltransferase domain-containing protein [Solirubrobacterales bacterium]